MDRKQYLKDPAVNRRSCHPYGIRTCGRRPVVEARDSRSWPNLRSHAHHRAQSSLTYWD